MHVALSICPPAVEVNGSKTRAGPFPTFHPEGLRAADPEFTMETPTVSEQQGSERRCRNVSNLELVITISYISFLSLHAEHSEPHQQ